MNMKTCKMCAWYCHTDGKCYVPCMRPSEVNKEYSCHDYTFDGLEDWERDNDGLEN